VLAVVIILKVMNKIEIKKEIERQNPIAEVDFERGDYIHYSTLIIIDGIEEIISFEVPMTQDPNVNELPAILLIDWLV
jgi:hypothetical protein